MSGRRSHGYDACSVAGTASVPTGTATEGAACCGYDETTRARVRAQLQNLISNGSLGGGWVVSATRCQRGALKAVGSG